MIAVDEGITDFAFDGRKAKCQVFGGGEVDLEEKFKVCLPSCRLSGGDLILSRGQTSSRALIARDSESRRSMF